MGVHFGEKLNIAGDLSFYQDLFYLCCVNAGVMVFKNPVSLAPTACGKPSEDKSTSVRSLIKNSLNLFIIFRLSATLPLFVYVLCVPVLWKGSSTGNRDACYSDLLLMCAFRQQVCVCASACARVCVSGLGQSGPRFRGGSQRQGQEMDLSWGIR